MNFRITSIILKPHTWVNQNLRELLKSFEWVSYPPIPFELPNKPAMLQLLKNNNILRLFLSPLPKLQRSLSFYTFDYPKIKCLSKNFAKIFGSLYFPSFKPFSPFKNFQRMPSSCTKIIFKYLYIYIFIKLFID